jgi:hypothetical protein
MLSLVSQSSSTYNSPSSFPMRNRLLSEAKVRVDGELEVRVYMPVVSLMTQIQLFLPLKTHNSANRLVSLFFDVVNRNSHPIS